MDRINEPARRLDTGEMVKYCEGRLDTHLPCELPIAHFRLDKNGTPQPRCRKCISREEQDYRKLPRMIIENIRRQALKGDFGLNSEAVLEKAVDAFGGVDNFVMQLKKDWDESKPGSTARSRLSEEILKMLERKSILDQHKKSEQDMQAEEDIIAAGEQLLSQFDADCMEAYHTFVVELIDAYMKEARTEGIRRSFGAFRRDVIEFYEDTTPKSLESPA